MSQYPIAYGITLAVGTVIENAHFELLAADPVPVSAGRIWYNTSDKVFRYSSLNNTGAVVVKTFASAEALAADIASLQASLSSEVSRATAAEAGLQSAIDSVVANLASEVARAQAAEAALQTNLDTVVTDMTLYVDQKVASLGNVFDYVGETSAAETAETAFDVFSYGSFTKTDAGSYYRVAQDGWLINSHEVGGGTPFQVKKGDGIVFNTNGGVDIIDNVDAIVYGTANYVTVTGNADVGYTVDVAQAFKDRVVSLEAAVPAEATRAQAAEAALQAAIDGLSAGTSSVIGDLATLLTTEKGTVVGAINEVYNFGQQVGTALVDEITRAQAAETQLGQDIAGVASDLAGEIARAKGVEGTLVSLTTDAKGNLVAAINEVDAHADAAAAAAAAEATRAQAAEAALQTAVDAEATRAQAAEATLTSDLAAEVTRATAAEATLTSDLAAEVTRATAAETALDTRVDALESSVSGATGDLSTLTTDAKTTLVAAINEVDAHADAANAAVAAEATRAQAAEATLTSDLAAEVTRATAAEATLTTNLNSVVTQLNDGKKTYKSVAAALTHTFVHGLNSEFVAFTVLVQRDDGLYRNDIVSVEEVDGNTLKVYINGTARNVKIIAESAVAVSL